MEARKANALVAEQICGWAKYEQAFHDRTLYVYWQYPEHVGQPLPPDYMTDRNACAEMEGSVEKAQRWGDYRNTLLEMFGYRATEGDIWKVFDCLLRATPAERAEAALRAYGLWEE